MHRSSNLPKNMYDIAIECIKVTYKLNIEKCSTVVPPNSRLIGSKKKPGIKRLNNSSKPFQPKVATK